MDTRKNTFAALKVLDRFTLRLTLGIPVSWEM